MSSEIMKGPSHCGASLCTFSCISRRTRSPLRKVLVRCDCFDTCVACPGILLTLLWLCPLLPLRCLYHPVVLLLPLLLHIPRFGDPQTLSRAEAPPLPHIP